jgi:hypothetical protein
MNNLTVSICGYGTEANVDGMTLGEMTLEPIFDMEKGQSWHGTFKVGDNTIGIYAVTLHDNAPEDKIGPFHKEVVPKTIG